MSFVFIEKNYFKEFEVIVKNFVGSFESFLARVKKKLQILL